MVSTKQNHTNARQAKFVIVALVLLGVTGSIFLVSFIWGRGGYTYFSPYTLEFSSQSEILVPLINLPIYQSEISSGSRNELIDYLIQNDYWIPESEELQPPIMTAHMNNLWRDGHSDLHRQLSWRADEWIKWSADHPKIARKLWPTCLALLRSESKESLPTASMLMLHASNVEEFLQMVSAQKELTGVSFAE